MKFKLKDIQPNPWRVGSYRQDKIDALIESINTTSFWDNIVARLRADGKPELAYGHHRLEALRKVYPTSHEIDLIVRDLDDAKMIQILARENDDDYKNDALTLLHSVRAVVRAYGAGNIELPRPDAKTNKGLLRYAPSFVVGLSSPANGEHPYTVDSVGKFLGKTRARGEAADSIRTALDAAELIEQGYLTEAALRDKPLAAVAGVLRDAQANRDGAEQRRKEAEERARLAAELKRKAEAREKELEEWRRKNQEKAAQRVKAEAERIKAEKATREAEAAERKAVADADKAVARVEAVKEHTRQATAAPIIHKHEFQVRVPEAGPEPVRGMVSNILRMAERIMTAQDGLQYDVEKLAKRKKELTDAQKRRIIESLTNAANRLEKAAQRFEGEK